MAHPIARPDPTGNGGSSAHSRCAGGAWRSVVDYLIEIHDAGTGRQPARQLFLLHRDAQARVACSLPGYLGGKTSGAEALVKRALPTVPAQVGAELPDLENVLNRFFHDAAPKRGRHLD